MCTGIWWGFLRGRDHLEYTGIDGRVILFVSSRNGMWSYGLEVSDSG